MSEMDGTKNNRVHEENKIYGKFWHIICTPNQDVLGCLGTCVFGVTNCVIPKRASVQLLHGPMNLDILTETLQKKFRIEIWTLSFQICFKNQFSSSGSGQTENTRICVYVYFQFDHFPKSAGAVREREERLHLSATPGGSI